MKIKILFSCSYSFLIAVSREMLVKYQNNSSQMIFSLILITSDWFSFHITRRNLILITTEKIGPFFFKLQSISIPAICSPRHLFLLFISNCNWTKWSTIQGVIGRFEIYEPDYPWIVWHEVQLLINRINNKIRD